MLTICCETVKSTQIVPAQEDTVDSAFEYNTLLNILHLGVLLYRILIAGNDFNLKCLSAHVGTFYEKLCKKLLEKRFETSRHLSPCQFGLQQSEAIFQVLFD